jgi:co-chaperonin GroES (HSP10)
MLLHPLPDRLAVRRVDAVVPILGGILLPGAELARSQQAEPVAVGSGRVCRDGSFGPLEARSGDRILFLGQ